MSFPRRTVDWIIENVHSGLIDLLDYPLGDIGADPLTNRCGDDQISLTKPRRALIFEGLIPLGGGILSPGVHLRSRSLGIFTKQLCLLDKTKRRVNFVDILRARQLSTPDSRLPRRKEFPPSWSRGEVASKELAWWDGPIRQSAVTFLFWRYHEFLRYATSLGIEIYLPKVLGGLYFPHYQKKVVFLHPKATKRMISILLRPDASLEHLLEIEKLGSLWTPLSDSPLGDQVEKHCKRILKRAITTPLETFCRKINRDPPQYPRIRDLRAFEKELLEIDLTELYPEYSEHADETDVFNGAMVLGTFIEKLKGKLYEKLSWSYPFPTITKVPSIAGIAKRFNSIQRKILERDPYPYPDLKISSWKSLEDGIHFKRGSLVVLNARGLLMDDIL